jgi:hypothetical protein
MKNKILLTILAIALLFGMTACGGSGSGDGGDDDGGGSPVTTTSPVYTGRASGTTYTLKITESAARAATGDGYELTNGSRKSRGSITGVTGTGTYTYTLKPSNSSTTYTVTVSQTSGITGISGTITWTDNTTTAGPGTLTGGNTGTFAYDIQKTSGKLTLSGIPPKFNGKYVMAVGFTESSDVDDSFLIALSTISTTNVTLGKISGGSVTMSVWKASGDDTYLKLANYTGNDKDTIFYMGVFDMATGDLILLEQDADDLEDDDDVKAVGFGPVKFSGGKGSVSVQGEDWMFIDMDDFDF